MLKAGEQLVKVHWTDAEDCGRLSRSGNGKTENSNKVSGYVLFFIFFFIILVIPK